MANIQESSFAPDTSVGTSFGAASSNILLPGTPASDSIVKVVNLGPYHIAVKLGTTNAVVATNNGAQVIPAGATQNFTLGSNLYIAGIALGGPGSASTVNITTGN
jgi:hypothetical protein